MRVPGWGSERLVQVAGQHLDGRPRAREGDRLHPAADEPLGQLLSREQRRPADPELLVRNRRVDDEDMALAAGRAVVVHQLDQRLDQPLGELARVGDGGARENEGGVRAVVLRRSVAGGE